MSAEDPIVEETRWSRTYAPNSQTGSQLIESKFLDGGLSITLAELSAEWPTWSKFERLDFCNAIACSPPADSADIFRYLAQDEAEYVRSSIASCVVRRLPLEESISLLQTWAKAAPVGRRANYLQALTHTADPCAHDILQDYCAVLLRHPQLMADAEWCNEIAHDLFCCIKYLLRLGTPADELRSAYETLSQHPCGQIREQTDRWLAESFANKSTPEA